jgi:Uma2 family endonuclease
MTTATAAPPTETLLTAEQYAELPDDGRRTELVFGKVVEMPQPGFRHGVLCNRIGRIVGTYVDARKLGRVLNNDAGVVTRRGPDTVRGPDVAFFSYDRVPAAEEPEGYPAVAPELVFEVRSPSNTWPAMSAKATEYLTAGVKVVCVLDADTASIGVYTAGEFPRRLTADEELTLPEVFLDFRVPVREFLG